MIARRVPSAAVVPMASIEALPESERAQGKPGSRVLVEAKLVWAGDALGITYVRPKALVRVADLGLEVALPDELVIAQKDGAGVALVLPNGALVPEACRMTLRFGRAISHTLS